jgi:hypothetical protein
MPISARLRGLARTCERLPDHFRSGQRRRCPIWPRSRDTLTFFGIPSGAEASVWGVAGIVPELAVQLWDTLAVDRDLERARELWTPLWELSDFLESVNYVAGVKAVPGGDETTPSTRTAPRTRRGADGVAIGIWRTSGTRQHT